MSTTPQGPPMTKNWGGQTSIVGVPEASSADLAEFGDQLIAQWK